MSLAHTAEQAEKARAGEGRPRIPGGLRDLAVALSLANVAFLKVWSQLLGHGVFVEDRVYAAALLNLALAGGLFWMPLRLARRRPGVAVLSRLLLAVPVAAALHGIDTLLFLNSDHPTARNLIYGVETVLLVAFVLSRRIAERTLAVYLVLCPFVAITVSQIAWRFARNDPAPFAVGPKLPLLPGPGPQDARVVWVVFDSWDYGVTYAHREPSLRLPELDRLRGEVFFSENAESIGPATRVVVPGLLSGKRTTDLAVASSGPNVFSLARDLGVNAGVIGWQVPYCDNFALPACRVFMMSWECNSMGPSLAASMRDELRILFEFEFRSPFGQLLRASGHGRLFGEWMQAARQAAVDPRLGLVYLHCPVPHEPFFYNRETGRNDVGSTPLLSFFRGLQYRDFLGALELMDQALGELRRSLEASGQWERTTLILTSDHPYSMRPRVDGRPVDTRVPLMVRFPGQAHGLTYQPRFSAIHTGSLALAILNGEVASAEQAAAWLDQHRE